MTFTSQERDASSSASLVPTPPGCSLFQQPSAVCPHKEKCNPAGRIRFRISSTSVQIDSAQLASFFFFVCWQWEKQQWEHRGSARVRQTVQHLESLWQRPLSLYAEFLFFFFQITDHYRTDISFCLRPNSSFDLFQIKSCSSDISSPNRRSCDFFYISKQSLVLVALYLKLHSSLIFNGKHSNQNDLRARSASLTSAVIALMLVSIFTSRARGFVIQVLCRTHMLRNGRGQNPQICTTICDPRGPP